jgi:arginyl-tRNA synthetase
VNDPVAELSSTVSAAAAALAGDGRVQQPKLDRPPRPDFGDYSTNAAMLLAPTLGEAPRAIAERLGDQLGTRLGAAVERVEIAGPGFLNLFMADAWYLQALAALLEAGRRYGAADGGSRLNVEFVSANPTGPITVASGRHAAYGDALCRILEFAGNEVEREFYINDYGSQVRRFGEAIRARARGEEPDQYKGEYVTELAERIDGAADADPDDLARRGIELMLAVSASAWTASSRNARSTSRARWRPPSIASMGSTSTRVRSGCERRPTATTRTACCGARQASTPTSPPISPTT